MPGWQGPPECTTRIIKIAPFLGGVSGARGCGLPGWQGPPECTRIIKIAQFPVASPASPEMVSRKKSAGFSCGGGTKPRSRK